MAVAGVSSGESFRIRTSQPPGNGSSLAGAKRRQPDHIRIPVIRQRDAPVGGHGRRGCRRHPALRVGDHHRLPTAGQQRCGDRPQGPEGSVVFLPEIRLGHPGRGVHQREGRRMHRRGRSADIDDTQQRAVDRVENRGGSAGPGVMGLDEMFGGVDLNGAGDHQRRTDGVGADAAFASSWRLPGSRAAPRAAGSSSARPATAPGPGSRRPP